MSPAALQLYDDGLRVGRSGRAAPQVIARMSDGTKMPVALDRFLGPADAVDEALLHDVRGPVLDLGCGPGRHLHALASRGVFALGVDLSPVAVSLARDRGATALVASVFDDLPGAGSWQTALLIDGNIGIGGAPVRLLQRVRSLLCERGDVLVELDPPGTSSGAVRVSLQRGRLTSDAFAWARVAPGAIEATAASAGFTVSSRWDAGGRWFARLSRTPD